MDRVVLGCTAALLVGALLLQEAASSKIRIEPGHGNTRGRLQVFHDGIWGTVCDDNFGNLDARVACGALGMNSKYAVPWNFGPGSGSILLDDLACHGTEENLDDCLHNGWGDHECEHSEDIGVICTDDEVMVTPTNVPVIVPDGDQVNFTCVALGNVGMPFRYHWFSGTQSVSRQSSILLTVGRHVFINDSLTCTLYSSNGSTLGSSTANIDVQYPPPALIETSHAVISGNDTCICGDGLGNPSATPIKWRKMGLTLQWNNCTCCMHGVDESDSGEYLVVMENTLVNNVMNTTKTGSGVQVVDLVIMYGAQVMCPSNYTAVENTTAVLECHVDAYPGANITWSREGSHEALPQTGSYLRIPHAQLSDGGNYTCTASNTIRGYTGRSYKKEDSCIIHVIVKDRENPADTSSSSCSPIRQTYIVGGSLGLIVLALMGLALLMLIRQHNPSAEKKSTEGDMVQDCTNQYHLHCVPRDQKNLSLSTCDNSCSHAEYPAVNVSRGDKHCQPHDTVDEHGDEPHYIEVETLMEAHDYEIV